MNLLSKDFDWSMAFFVTRFATTSVLVDRKLEAMNIEFFTNVGVFFRYLL